MCSSVNTLSCAAMHVHSDLKFEYHILCVQAFISLVLVYQLQSTCMSTWLRIFNIVCINTLMMARLDARSKCGVPSLLLHLAVAAVINIYLCNLSAAQGVQDDTVM